MSKSKRQYLRATAGEVDRAIRESTGLNTVTGKNLFIKTIFPECPIFGLATVEQEYLARLRYITSLA